MAQIQQAGTPINLTASGAISLCRGSILGFYVNSTTAGTIVVKDGGTSGTALGGTITPSVGWQTYPFTITSASGAYATIGGTIDVTFSFAAGG